MYYTPVLSILAADLVFLSLHSLIMSLGRIAHFLMTFRNNITCDSNSDEVNIEKVAKFNDNLSKQVNLGQYRYTNMITNVIILTFVNYWIVNKLYGFISYEVLNFVVSSAIAIVTVALFEVMLFCYKKVELYTFMISLGIYRSRSGYVCKDPILQELVAALVRSELCLLLEVMKEASAKNDNNQGDNQGN